MIVGLDIGRQYVKAVQLDKTRSGYKVQNAVTRLVPEPNRPFDPEKIDNPAWVVAIRELFRELNVKPKKVKHLVSSISSSNISVKQITTMEMATDELYSAMNFEARKHIPMDGTDAVIDFQVFGSNKKEVDKIDVGLVACTKGVLNTHLELLKDSGLKAGIVDADPIALTNLFTHLHDYPEDGVVVMLDIGALSSTVVVWGRQDQYFTRDIPIGGHQFVKWLSDKKSLDYTEAQEKLSHSGLELISDNDTAPEEDATAGAISVADRTVFDNLVEDLRRSLRYYAKSTGQSYFLKIFLTGGAADIPGLSDFIHEKLNVDVDILNPFVKFEQPDDLEIPHPSRYAIAAGLAMRGGMTK